jgi:hypothetical protein
MLDVLGSFHYLIFSDSFRNIGDWSFVKDVEGIHIHVLSILSLCEAYENCWLYVYDGI